MINIFFLYCVSSLKPLNFTSGVSDLLSHCFRVLVVNSSWVLLPPPCLVSNRSYPYWRTISSLMSWNFLLTFKASNSKPSLSSWKRSKRWSEAPSDHVHGSRWADNYYYVKLEELWNIFLSPWAAVWWLKMAWWLLSTVACCDGPAGPGCSSQIQRRPPHYAGCLKLGLQTGRSITWHKTHLKTC